MKTSTLIKAAIYPLVTALLLLGSGGKGNTATNFICSSSNPIDGQAGSMRQDLGLGDLGTEGGAGDDSTVTGQYSQQTDGGNDNCGGESGNNSGCNSGSPILIDLAGNGFNLTDLADGVNMDLDSDGVLSTWHGHLRILTTLGWHSTVTVTA